MDSPDISALASAICRKHMPDVVDGEECLCAVLKEMGAAVLSAQKAEAVVDELKPEAAEAREAETWADSHCLEGCEHEEDHVVLAFHAGAKWARARRGILR